MKKKLIIFIKYPEDGTVKTRLARDIGEKKAMEVYKELAGKTIEKIKDAQLTYMLLPKKNDVDLLEDYEEYMKTREVKI